MAECAGLPASSDEGSRDDIVRMNAAQAWRGPDGSGVWSDPAHGVYLGHVRLAIIDLDGGAQPMWTPDGEIGIVFNGEIYNHAELREELRALALNSSPITRIPRCFSTDIGSGVTISSTD